MKALLGPRTAEDDKPLEKKDKPKEVKKEEKPKEVKKEAAEADDEWIPPQDSIRFPDPSENTQQTPEILAAHMKRTGGKHFESEAFVVSIC